MRFATLVALAVVVSTTPGLAAPTPYTPNRASFKRDTTTNGIALVQNSTVSAELGTDITKFISDAIPEIEQLLRHATNGTAANSPMTPKRDVSNVIQDIEALLGSILRKRDATASVSSAFQPLLEETTPELGYAKRALASDDLQGLLESLGVSNTQRSVEDRSVISEAALSAAAKDVSFASCLTKISKFFGGSSTTSSVTLSGAAKDVSLASCLTKVSQAAIGRSATKREWNTAINGIGPKRPPAGSTIQFDNPTLELPHSQDRRGFSTPKVTTREVSEAEIAGIKSGLKSLTATKALSNLGNILTIGAGIQTIVGSLTNNTLKRELIQTFDGIDLADLLDGTTAQVQDRRGLSIPKISSISGLLKDLGNIASIGAIGIAVADAFKGSSNSTSRRELAHYHAIDLIPLLNGSIPLFDDPFTIPVSTVEVLPRKRADTISVEDIFASMASSLDEYSSSSKRDLGFDTSAPSRDEKRSIFGDIFKGLISVLGDVLGGSKTSSSSKRDLGFDTSAPSDDELTDILKGLIGGSGTGSNTLIKRSTSDNDILDLIPLDLTPQQLQLIAAQMRVRGADLD